jgi:hypothetical protein
MRYRIGIATLGLLLLVGCGVSDIETVNGTIERIGVQEGGFGKGVETRYLQLTGSSTVYTCEVGPVPTCLLLKEGDQLTLQVGYNRSYAIDNYVVKAEVQ